MQPTEINKVNELYRQIDVLRAENEALKGVNDRLDKIEATLNQLVESSCGAAAGVS